MNYRYDVRTRDQFIEDIRVCTSKEKEIAMLFKQFYERRYGEELVITNNGCDNSGTYLDDKNVSTASDFVMNGRLMEIKFSNKFIPIFRFKIDQIRSYIKQRSYLLMVNGFDTGDPKFKIFSPKELLHIRNLKKPVEFSAWGNKLVYELHIKDYNWHSFK